jgi:4-amino-4-deoxy-L-arabinose transferase-like glycosyltransferase
MASVMQIGLLVLATTIVVAGAWWWNRLMGWTRLADSALSLFSMVVAQIVAAQLIAGAALSAYRPLPVLAAAVVLAAVPLSLALRRRRRGVRGPGAARPARFSRIRAALRDAVRSPWALALAAAAVAVTMLQLVSAYLLPVHAWDGLFYHLVSIAYWLQEGSIGIVPFAIWSNVYPQNAHMVFSWLVLFWRNDLLVELGQWLFALAGAVAVAGLARSIGSSRAIALSAGCLYLLTPLVIAQATANYVDLAFASMFLVSYYFVYRYIQESGMEGNGRSWPALIMAGIAGGLMLGMKSSSAANMGIVGVVLVAHALYLLWRRWLSWPELLARAGIFAALVIAFGSFWYIRAWVVYGNPLYPFTIEAGGWTIFPGKGSVHDMIMVPNTPQVLAELPKWKQIWMSWTNEPQTATYEQRLGGYGLQWLYVLVPASVTWIVYSMRARLGVFLTLCLPFLLMFLVQPTPWWGRYTLFLVGFACVAYAGLLSVLRQGWARWVRLIVQTLCVALVAVSLWYQHPPESIAKLRKAAALPRTDRTLGQLYYSDYAFLDALPNGTRIALRFGDFAYPFFGDHFQNRVYALQMKDEASFWRLIREEQIDILFTITLEPYDDWANSRPDVMEPILMRERYAAYRVIGQP